MMLKRLFALFALLTVLISSVAFAAPAVAQEPEQSAPELCREVDEQGLLDEIGINRGECVNILMGFESENFHRVIVGFCGSEDVQEFTETTNKGQCIKVLTALFENQG